MFLEAHKIKKKKLGMKSMEDITISSSFSSLTFRDYGEDGDGLETYCMEQEQSCQHLIF